MAGVTNSSGLPASHSEAIQTTRPHVRRCSQQPVLIYKHLLQQRSLKFSQNCSQTFFSFLEQWWHRRKFPGELKLEQCDALSSHAGQEVYSVGLSFPHCRRKCLGLNYCGYPFQTSEQKEKVTISSVCLSLASILLVFAPDHSIFLPQFLLSIVGLLLLCYFQWHSKVNRLLYIPPLFL